MAKFTIYKYIDDTSDDPENMVPTDEAWIDGYEIGDRLLEGLPIRITLNADGSDINVWAAWPEYVNGEYFTAKVKEYAIANQSWEMSSSNKLNDDNCILDYEA